MLNVMQAIRPIKDVSFSNSLNFDAPLSPHDVGHLSFDKRKEKVVSSTRLATPITRSKAKQLEPTQFATHKNKTMDLQQGKESNLVLIGEQ